MKKKLHITGRKKGVKTSHSNKKKLQKRLNDIYMRSIEHTEPGPSKFIKKDENGKLTFIKRTGNKKQAEYTTKVAKDAMQENKSTCKSKKDLIKKILAEAGYEPTVHYTRKQKKHFTRIVKDKLFEKPKPVKILSKEEYKEKFKAERAEKKIRLQNLPHIRELTGVLPVVKGKQRPIPVSELIKKEKPNLRKFRYSVNRKEENSNRVYDFLTDYFDASTRKEAMNKAKEFAKKYKKDELFRGITVQDINGDNSITYYTREKLAA